jgi:hypothetical protein
MDLPRRLAIADCIAEGWRAYRRHPGLGAALVLPIVAIFGLSSVPFVGPLLVFFVLPALHGGVCRLALRLVEDRHPRVHDLIAPLGHWRTFLGAWLMVGGGVLVTLAVILAPPLATSRSADIDLPGTVVLGLLGLVLIVAMIGLRFLLFPYALADDPQVGQVNAVRWSWRTTRGLLGRLTLLASVVTLLQVVGIAAFGVGVLITLPVGCLALASAYVRVRSAALPGSSPRAEALPEAHVATR